MSLIFIIMVVVVMMVVVVELFNFVHISPL